MFLRRQNFDKAVEGKKTSCVGVSLVAKAARCEGISRRRLCFL